MLQTIHSSTRFAGIVPRIHDHLSRRANDSSGRGSMREAHAESPMGKRIEPERHTLVPVMEGRTW